MKFSRIDARAKKSQRERGYKPRLRNAGQRERGWKPRLRNAGYRQTQVETAPMERGLPVGAVCNRAYQGRRQTSLETAPMERGLRLS